MSRYTVHGRRLEGSLAAPTCNETESDERDVYDEAIHVAQDMSRRGLSAWIYEDQLHERPDGPAFTPMPWPGGGRWRTVAQWRPFGVRVR